MSRLSKFLSLIVVIVFLLACNLVTQPINDAQDLAQTAQAMVSQIPIETLQAGATAIASAIPVETLQALPTAFASAVSQETLEALPSALPDFENIFNPQGTPVQEWRGVPVMPQATAGQEFSENNTYSFRANVTVQDVQAFYKEKMAALGWKQPMEFPVQAEGGLMVFEKDNSTLTITMTSSEGSVVVLLTIA